MGTDLLIYNIKKIYAHLDNRPLCGSDMEKVEEIEDAYIAIKDGKILAAGKSPNKNPQHILWIFLSFIFYIPLLHMVLK
ncbi:hypothetical protein [Thermoanaerobacter thermocopriae]|uniref:hypothetical protein n=1 Tax=Thermoanaerobacter thermocopriae TaxID=29350 RepID=UPI0006D25FC8|nr:hypothetical protein [Thermoanaerobacter thermocopriae]